MRQLSYLAGLRREDRIRRQTRHQKTMFELLIRLSILRSGFETKEKMMTSLRQFPWNMHGMVSSFGSFWIQNSRKVVVAE